MSRNTTKELIRMLQEESMQIHPKMEGRVMLDSLLDAAACRLMDLKRKLKELRLKNKLRKLRKRGA